MKTIIGILVLCMSAQLFAGDRVTSDTRKFGTGTITHRSDGSRMVTSRFGTGTISRESFRSGKSATHMTYKFGSGTITKSRGSYVRKP